VEEENVMTESPRLTKLKEMVARSPDDPRARFFLAHELFRVEDWAGAAEQYDAYWRMAPGDEGAALKNLGLCYERMHRVEDAAEAYRNGIERAEANGHAGLASELRFLLDALTP
jgi:thioredoxin-like negative regulator of GroEL